MKLSPKDRDGWLTRWREGRIQFHVDEVNPILDRYIDRLLPGGSGRVLVPLCGKSVDLGWLVKQGHQVVGVELVEKAVDDLFKELGRSPTISTQDVFQSWRSDGLEVLVCDLFELDTEFIGKFDAIWDRAALVALRPSDRDCYAPTFGSSCSPMAKYYFAPFPMMSPKWMVRRSVCAPTKSTVT